MGCSANYNSDVCAHRFQIRCICGEKHSTLGEELGGCYTNPESFFYETCPESDNPTSPILLKGASPIYDD